MSDLALVVQQLGHALLGGRARCCWRRGALLLAALVLDRLLERRVSAATRIYLYLTVVARLALPVGWATPVGLLGGRAGAPLVSGDVPSIVAGTTTAPAIGVVTSGAFWLAVAYLVVVLGLLVRWTGARLALARQLRLARPARAAVAALVPAANVLEHPTLGPLVAGVLRPRIVLPRTLADRGPEAALACVLRHERAHLERRDHVLMAVLQLACVVAWPILPLWIAALRVRALSSSPRMSARSRARPCPSGAAMARSCWPSPRRRPGPPLRLGAGVRCGVRGRLRALAPRRRWPRARNVASCCCSEPRPWPARAPPSRLRLRQRQRTTDARAAAARSAPACQAPDPALRPAGPVDVPPPISPVEKGPVAPDSDSRDCEEARRSPAPLNGAARGSLDKQIIRGVIRGHIGEVKACYERELVSLPQLAGRVEVQFTIGATGHVVASLLQRSTMGTLAWKTAWSTLFAAGSSRSRSAAASSSSRTRSFSRPASDVREIPALGAAAGAAPEAGERQFTPTVLSE